MKFPWLSKWLADKSLFTQYNFNILFQITPLMVWTLGFSYLYNFTTLGWLVSLTYPTLIATVLYALYLTWDYSNKNEAAQLLPGSFEVWIDEENPVTVFAMITKQEPILDPSLEEKELVKAPETLEKLNEKLQEKDRVLSPGDYVYRVVPEYPIKLGSQEFHDVLVLSTKPFDVTFEKYPNQIIPYQGSVFPGWAFRVTAAYFGWYQSELDKNTLILEYVDIPSWVTSRQKGIDLRIADPEKVKVENAGNLDLHKRSIEYQLKAREVTSTMRALAENYRDSREWGIILGGIFANNSLFIRRNNLLARIKKMPRWVWVVVFLVIAALILYYWYYVR